MDSLAYCFPDLSWSLENHCFDPIKKLPIYTLVDEQNKRFWQIKSDKGYPWDCNGWTEQAITQILTDGSGAAWSSPTTFHQFVPPLLWMPRYLASFNPPAISPTTYRAYTNGVPVTANLGGPAMTEVELVPEYDFGGDVGAVECLMQRYYWGWTPNGYTTMETSAYVKGLGLVQWQTWALSISIAPVLKDQSLYNMKVAGGIPLLSAPMGVPA